MSFINKMPEWENEGTEPSAELKLNGFAQGYKPPAGVFNWFWSLISKAITELQNNVFLKAGGKLSGAIDMSGNKVTNLSDPNADSDAVNKKYADKAHLISNLSAPHEVEGYLLLAKAQHTGWGSSSILLCLQNGYSGRKFNSLVSIQVNGNATELFTDFTQIAGPDITDRLVYVKDPTDQSISYYLEKDTYNTIYVSTLAKYGSGITVRNEPIYETELNPTGNAVYEVGVSPLPIAKGGTGADSAENARKNIGAAPAGYGYGEQMAEIGTSSSETYEQYCAKIDNILATMPNNTTKLISATPPYSEAPSFGSCAAMLYKGTNAYASLIPVGHSNIYAYEWRMQKRNSVWQPFEWSNPPMESGVEYRTTKRFDGKPVYIKQVSLESVPQNDLQEFDVGYIGTIISAKGYYGYYFNGAKAYKEILFTDLEVFMGGMDIQTPQDAAYCQIVRGENKLRINAFEANTNLYNPKITLEYIKTDEDWGLG